MTLHSRILSLAAVILAAAFFTGAVLAGNADTACASEMEYQEKLERLRVDLDKAQKIWEESIDDEVSDQELKRNYHALQDLCRELYKRKSGFGTARQKQLC
mgnify:CR=1 FL=1